MQTVYVGIRVYSTCVCLAKNIQKNQINYCICGNCVHRNRPCAHTDTTPGSACSHVIQGIFFSPCCYLNPDLVQHWETTLAFLLTAVNQSKERAFGKHQHIEGHTISPPFMVLVLSVNGSLIYWKCLVLICISESSK